MLTGLYDDIKAKGGAEREAELEGLPAAPVFAGSAVSRHVREIAR